MAGRVFTPIAHNCATSSFTICPRRSNAARSAASNNAPFSKPCQPNSSARTTSCPRRKAASGAGVLASKRPSRGAPRGNWSNRPNRGGTAAALMIGTSISLRERTHPARCTVTTPWSTRTRSLGFRGPYEVPFTVSSSRLIVIRASRQGVNSYVPSAVCRGGSTRKR